MVWNSKLPPESRYHVWQSLIVSKFGYANFFLSSLDKKLDKQMVSLHYNLLKNLFGIQKKISTERTYEVTLGLSSEDFITMK